MRDVEHLLRARGRGQPVLGGEHSLGVRAGEGRRLPEAGAGHHQASRVHGPRRRPQGVLLVGDRRLELQDAAIDEAREAGIEEFIFVTSRGKGALEDYFDNAPVLEADLVAKGKDA